MWQNILTMRLINQHRDGWLGVWDALKSAITGKERVSVPRPLTVELNVYSKIGPVQDAAMQLEGEDNTKAQVDTTIHIDGVAIKMGN